MRFCEKCGNMLVVEKKRKNSYLVCRKCHRVYKTKGEKFRISSAVTEGKKRVIVMSEKDQFSELPKTRIMCTKCENMESYWWMQQTRSADEPPTMFYRCTKCG